MASTHHRNRCFSGTQNTHVFIFRRRIDERAAISFRRMPVVRCDDEPGQAPERWIAAALALFDLVAVEGLAVAGDQRAHDRMFRLMCLQKTYAPPLLAARAADHLGPHPECASGGPR